MDREQKEVRVQDLKKYFDKYDTFYLVDFLKMSVFQATELRRQFRENSFHFRVLKNRLALRALGEEFPEELRDRFQGPTAISFAPQNPIGLARLIKNFSAQHKVLAVKGGMLEGQYFSGDQFKEIARLNSRDDLVAKIGYLMAMPLIQLSRTWQAPLNSLGRLLTQYKTKK
jgi:large subunit ribosomal protein L10